jgi:hypothetical protein
MIVLVEMEYYPLDRYAARYADHNLTDRCRRIDRLHNFLK